MNLYVVLGVRREASLEEIKRAFRRLARRYHPDINPGDRDAAERFRRISMAYEILSDPDRRQRYDVEGQVAMTLSVGSALEFTGFDFTVSTDTSAPPTFGELFEDVLRSRGAAANRGPEPGADLHAAVAIGFDESMRGTTALVPVTRLERCAPCLGFGRISGVEARCVHCDGVGQVRMARGHMVFSRMCAACSGTGLVQYRTCAACGGEGVGVHNGTVTAPIPAGVDDGTELLVPGEGHAGRRGGEAGALRLRVNVTPHRLLRRVGDDIALEVPVAVHEAALGSRIVVPTVDGRLRMRIPPGTQSGQTFRFRDRGAPMSNGRRGDFVVSVRIVLPRLLDERSRELLREFGERNPESVRDAWFDGVQADPTDHPAAPPTDA